MKGLIKSTTAALALFALASCSDDFGTSSWFGADQQKGVYVEVEGMTNPVTTRAAYDPANKNQLYWQVKDELRILDATMQKYDKYQFTKDNLFANIKTTSHIEEPVYALFGDPVSHGWDYDTDGVTADFDIPAEWAWEEATVGEDEVEAYQSKLPMWGEAQADEEYGIKATLRYLTAILKVNLANVPSNATSIKVEAFDDLSGNTGAKLSGIFRAEIATGGKDNKDAQLKIIKDMGGYGNSITVDVSEATREKSVLYIPIVPGTYKLLRISYWDGKTMSGDPAIPTYKTLKSFKNVKFTRGAVASATIKEFATGGASLESLSKAIALKADGSDDIEIKTTDNTVATVADKSLIVPMTDNNITVTLKQLGTLATDGSTEIIIDDNGDGFAKTFTLNLTAVDATNGVSKINLQMPEADVCLIGALSAIEVTGAAKSLTIGDATKAATATTLKTLTPVADMGDITINGTLSQTTDLTIPNNALTTKITVNGEVKGNINVAAFEDEADPEHVIGIELGNKAVAKNITAVCDITVPYVDKDTKATVEDITTKGDVTVAGVAKNVTSEGDITITGSVTGTETNDGAVTATKGDVIVNTPAEAEAIKGTLTIADGATLTWTQGYINKIDGPTGDDKSATVQFGTTAAFTAVKEVTGNVTFKGTSKWNSKAAGNSFSSTYGASQGKIYTAIQLAQYTGGAEGGAELYADIDLDGATTANWTPIALTKAFDGKNHTIKNINVIVPGADATVAATADDATKGLGLFSSIAAKVSNLTLDGVTVAAKQFTVGGAKYGVNNIGALAGQSAGNSGVEIENVTIKNATLSSVAGEGANVNDCNIGGVVGYASKAITLEGVQVSSTSITGYHSLGGFVGAAADNFTVQKYNSGEEDAEDVLPSAVVTFAHNFDANAGTGELSTYDWKYAQVGNFLGTFATGKALSISDVAAANITAACTHDYSAYTKVVVGKVIENKAYEIVYPNQTLIGYSDGATATDKASITATGATAATDYGISLTTPAAADLSAKKYLFYIKKAAAE